MRSWKFPASSLYEATENKIQVSVMAISKKIEQGPQSHLFRNNRLPSGLNVEVEGADVKVITYLESRSSRSQAKVCCGAF
jgi:hypothetical protein